MKLFILFNSLVRRRPPHLVSVVVEQPLATGPLPYQRMHLISVGEPAGRQTSLP
jgi:hypothetical protein